MAVKPRNDRGRSPSRIRHLAGFSALIMVIFCTIVIYQGSQGYRTALKEGEEDARRLTRILSDHVELTFLGADLALRRAIERQYISTLFGNTKPQYMEQNFRVWLNETPQIAALALVNDQGAIEVAAHKPGYEKWLDYSKGMLGETLFKRMKDSDERFVFIGRHESEGAPPLIILSRRFNRSDGQFGGIAVAAIDPAYFSSFYDSIAFGEQRYMALTLADGTLLASGPVVSSANDALARQITRESVAEAKVDETWLKTLAVGKIIKIAASRRQTNTPIVHSVVLDETDVLAGWRKARAKDIGFLALFTVFGSVLAFVAIAMARQISRAEESEEAAILASQAKSDFLANMSHELRTPLNAIIGFSEMMNSGYFGALSVKQKERIHDINLCGTHLLQLISDILEFSKGDAGKLELVEEPVDIPEIIGECERIMSGKIRSRHLQFSTAIEPGMPLLWGDRRKIRQVLLNLITNAVKFTPEGGSIKMTALMDAQNGINLIVSDTGIGIAEPDIPRALSVFGQVNRAKSHEGTGLGLPLCKMYAELHGGRLLLTSKPGEGTSVRIIFPSQRTIMGGGRN